jgi:hypothetical protein
VVLLTYSEFNFRPNRGSFRAHPSPHGYEKSPSHVDYSFKNLKVVRVREVRGSNPVPRVESTRLAQKASRVILKGTLIRGLETADLKALKGKGASRAHPR